LGLNAWDRAAFLNDAKNLQTQSPYDEEAMKQRPGQIIFKRGIPTERPLAHDRARWSLARLDVNAVALASNAVVAAHAKGFRESKGSERSPDPRGATIRYDGWAGQRLSP